MKKLFYLIFCIPFLFSCDKEKEVELLPIDILTGGNSKKWDFKKYIIDGNDMIADPCYADDFLMFYKNFERNNLTVYKSTYQWHFGKDFCGLPATEPLSVAFTISGDGKIFYLDSTPFHIRELTATSFIIESTEDSPAHQYIEYINTQNIKPLLPN